jgi:hypothetical protein
VERKIWKEYEKHGKKPTLIVEPLLPQHAVFPGVDWIIGNHSGKQCLLFAAVQQLITGSHVFLNNFIQQDELTPWIRILHSSNFSPFSNYSLTRLFELSLPQKQREPGELLFFFFFSV